MAEINVLDSSIFNRIAAGEVVENASSIVKELVENSIDAGAKTITIEIQNGGNALIRVCDDGKGIAKNDMPTAFLPHATSKIKSLSDLDNILTLGFRGEALPSICSVSKVTIVSKQKNDALGFCLVYENGKLLSEFEVGATNGTTVNVENLFNNIPARKKFLKRDSIEAARVTDLIQKLILANPNIVFKYINEGNIVYHSSGQGIHSAIYTIYGESVSNLSQINSTMSDIVLEGYISKPTFSKHNKTFQTLIVNGRVVENEEISYCVFLCYQEYLMKRQYPMYVLYLNVPLDTVDVNVHPNKLQIKFSDFGRIKNCIMGAVKKCINLEILSPKAVASFAVASFNDSSNSFIKTDNEEPSMHISSDLLFKNSGANKAAFTPSFNPEKTKTVLNEPSGLLGGKTSSNLILAGYTKSDDFKATYTQNIKEKQVQNDMGISADLIIVGKLFNTYIILQRDNDVFLVDQHAAHERILYDKLIEQIENQKPILQDLLLPFVFSVSTEEYDLIMSAKDSINKCGFILSEFNEKAFSVHAVPLVCSNINLQEFTFELLRELKMDNLRKSSFIKNSLAQAACKAAIKGKDDLSKTEMEELVKQIESSSSPLLCPHGRPTIIKITRRELEQWFKRIV